MCQGGRNSRSHFCKNRHPRDRRGRWLRAKEHRGRQGSWREETSGGFGFQLPILFSFLHCETPYHTTFTSHDPFDHLLHIQIPVIGDHATLGLVLMLCPHRQRLQLKDMAQGTPGSHPPKWRSTLRHSYLITCHQTLMYIMDQLINVISQAKQAGIIKVHC